MRESVAGHRRWKKGGLDYRVERPVRLVFGLRNEPHDNDHGEEDRHLVRCGVEPVPHVTWTWISRLGRSIPVGLIGYQQGELGSEKLLEDLEGTAVCIE